MKTVIKIVSARKTFTADQEQIIRRVALVLTEHNLSVAIVKKVKKAKTLKLIKAS